MALINILSYLLEVEYNISNTEYIKENQYIIQVIDLEMGVGVFSVNADIELSTASSGVLVNDVTENGDMDNAFCILLFLDNNGHVVLRSNIVRLVKYNCFTGSIFRI